MKKFFKEKNKNYFQVDSILSTYNNKEFTDKDRNLRFLELSLKNGYLIGQIAMRNNIGRILRREADYDQSIKYHKKALELAQKIGQPEVEAFTLNLLGACYRRDDDVRNALNCHQAALTISKRNKDNTLNNKKNISISINSIGNIYLSLQQYNLALNEFEKSLDISKELNNEIGIAINYENIGFAQENLLMFDDAIKNYEESLKVNEKLNSTRGKIICFNNLSSVYRKKGSFGKALKYIEDIYPTAIEYNSNYYLARTLSNYGGALLKNNKLEEAELKLNEALKVAKKYSFKKSEIISTGFLADLYEQQDKYDLALDYYKKSVKVEKDAIGQKNLSYVNNLISKHDLQSKINEIAYLETQSEIESLQFYRNRNILIITLITIALLSIALYSIYRQRLLNNDRKILLLEQQALQTQMNPHFIFNALNSIKLYIINNEQKQAVYYLNKFSKLIRNILDVSKIKEVSLKEELATMDLYMSIENIRFSNEINYQVDINPDMNTDTIKVPPLILQPFLENALWHGLSSKKSDKQIKLTANKVSDTVVEVNIIDNGIGRNAAAKIKEGKSLKRKSVGIDLTKERLKTFSEDYDDEFSLTYHDLTNEDGSPAGTKVSLRFPVA
ncbi:MAG: tetratricopeptide repeat protein [Tenacibaculum sp.]|nr:tetratricopeptide repeat protein [Tenacibaculum sp.]